MPKVRRCEDGKGNVIGHMIECPACGNGHLFDLNRWTFNGDMEKPTFRPSMCVRVNDPSHKHYNPQAESSVCHSYVTDGKIEFGKDCTHAMAGQTVDLPDF